jgi:hypothetical protein
MKLRKLISKHKTTITGLITAALLIAGIVRWLLGQIDAMELGAYSGVVGGIAATIIGLLTKDGNLSKTKEGGDNA